MSAKSHWFIYIDNYSDKKQLLERLYQDLIPQNYSQIDRDQIALFSKSELDQFIDEESRHEIKILTKTDSQDLATMSSGEQRKLLLNYLNSKSPKLLILDHPFDHLDQSSRHGLIETLQTIAKKTLIIQMASRVGERLPFIAEVSFLKQNNLTHYKTINDLLSEFDSDPNLVFSETIPKPLKPILFDDKFLIQLSDVNVSYDEKPILKSINWKIETGSFWQLAGKNGSGKTTLLSMITGENVKGYGQDLYIFGQKKGSGESVWDLKRKIGYFAPTMIGSFLTNPSALHMVVSGLFDSVGLYQKPSTLQLKLATKWLKVIHLEDKKHNSFRKLTLGQQRLVMIARAMIKHPPLLILDEPTEGLDDENAEICVALINKIAMESNTAIIYVSHRIEPKLKAQNTFLLKTTKQGSIGQIE